MGDSQNEESNCDQSRNKRSFSPEIEEVKLRKNIEKELDQRFAAIAKRNENPADQVKVLQDALCEATFRERLNEKKYETTRLELKEFSIRELGVTVERNVAEFILGLRSVIERRTEELSPEWLRRMRDVNLEYRYQVILDQDGNDNVRILHLRMAENKISPATLGSNLDYFWDRICLEYHEGAVPELTDEEMELVFKKLRITDDDKKATVKVIAKGFKKEERAAIFKPGKSKKKGFLFIRNVPYSYTSDHLEEFIVKNATGIQEGDIKRVVILEEKRKSIGRAFVFTYSFGKALTIHNAINGISCEQMTLMVNEPQLFQ